MREAEEAKLDSKMIKHHSNHSSFIQKIRNVIELILIFRGIQPTVEMQETGTLKFPNEKLEIPVSSGGKGSIMSLVTRAATLQKVKSVKFSAVNYLCIGVSLKFPPQWKHC